LTTKIGITRTSAYWVRQRCQDAPGRVAPIRGQQPRVGIGGDQPDPGKAPGGQRPQERQPARPVLGGGELDAQDFAVALGVDPDGDRGVHVDHPPGFADLEHEGIGGQERARPASSDRVRDASTAVSSSLAITDTCDLDNEVMPRVSTSLRLRRSRSQSGK
jgi:hypothetical protein